MKLGNVSCVASDDSVKRELELTCDECGEYLCDVEDGDSIEILSGIATEHQCEDRLFIGLFPAGVVYADRKVERHGDYKRLAFLSYDTLKLEVEKDCPKDLRGRIEDDAQGYKAGQSLRIADNCTITLGKDQQKENQ